jgi:hypothetical protein
MLKLIIFSLLGKKIVSSRVLFNSIKSYLIIYMMVLPAFLSAHEPGNGSRATTVDEMMQRAEMPEQALGIPGSLQLDCEQWETIERKDFTCLVLA